MSRFSSSPRSFPVPAARARRCRYARDQSAINWVLSVVIAPGDTAYQRDGAALSVGADRAPCDAALRHLDRGGFRCLMVAHSRSGNQHNGAGQHRRRPHRAHCLPRNCRAARPHPCGQHRLATGRSRWRRQRRLISRDLQRRICHGCGVPPGQAFSIADSRAAARRRIGLEIARCPPSPETRATGCSRAGSRSPASARSMVRLLIVDRQDVGQPSRCEPDKAGLAKKTIVISPPLLADMLITVNGRYRPVWPANDGGCSSRRSNGRRGIDPRRMPGSGSPCRADQRWLRTTAAAVFFPT
ncbi:unnamed protein product [Acanthosepion pharaonis]|uniref:Uncharacterized protein n=1 Tax=Acanthosepion pharaonis TaxID=158019 RepID=A0A812DH76_ACAPH|nr:unnamed protein product [Sepia pharaonis]